MLELVQEARGCVGSGTDGVRTYDESPAKVEATQAEPLIEVVRAALDRAQDGSISVR